MKAVPKDFERPSVPSAYVALWLAMLERRGIAAERVLGGTGLEQAQLAEPDHKVTGLAWTLVVAKSLQLTNDPTLAYRFGLEMKPTSHGFLGYALLTCSSARDAIRLAERYIRLRAPKARLSLGLDGELAVLTLTDDFTHGPIRQFALEVITAAMLRAAEMLLGEKPEGEIWVDYPEPPYYQSLRDELPPVRFGMPRNELRFPKAYLDRPLALGDPVAADAAVAQLERELTLASEEIDDVVARVRAALTDRERPFAELGSVAKRLGMSERTLKRRLKLRGTSYQRLLDEARRERAVSLLQNGGTPIDQVSAVLGYGDPANFTRAFRKWTGLSPTAWRRSQGR